MIGPVLARFKCRLGAVKEDPAGDLVRLADVRPLILAAQELELLGASVERLQKLARELRRVGL